eukprot:4392972-Ditylum_brightwellii.AAC.1
MPPASSSTARPAQGSYAQIAPWGDPMLWAYTDEPSNTIADHFYSLNCYRQGGHTQITRGHTLSIRKATLQEIIEHGRWRTNATRDMPLHYNE